jgi:hypothetical protein
MADGPLKLERQVEEHVVGPLLRMALLGLAGAAWKRQYRTPDGGIADYVITRRSKPTAVVEAKVAIAAPWSGRWSTSRHFAQVSRYCSELGVPGPAGRLETSIPHRPRSLRTEAGGPAQVGHARRLSPDWATPHRCDWILKDPGRPRAEPVPIRPGCDRGPRRATSPLPPRSSGSTRSY